MGDGFGAIVSTIPLGRAANPDEIAEAIVFFASNRARRSHDRYAGRPAACRDPSAATHHRRPVDLDD
jgi:NAD(P)-dependent dehydrogenase (short-subunit alcohol dehydrogenase family)